MKGVEHLLKMTIKVYKERGLKELIRRVFLFGREFFSVFFFGGGDVLYVSGCPGSSQFYRCRNQAEELAQHGIKAKIISQNNFGMLRLVKKFKIFIFQRTIYNKHIAKIIEEIKKQKKEIIFETDDLVFNPAYIPKMHYYNFMSDEEKRWYENGIGREILEDSYAKNCITSTDFLGEKIKEKYPDKNIFISENKLNKEQIWRAEKALAKKEKAKARNGKIRIGYFSGSKSHDADFETVLGAVLKILKENSDATLMVVGHLNVNGNFSEVKNQIENRAFVPLKKLPELIALSDINIIPLEIDNPFCQAKSGLKFFEAGMVEVPTIATATEPLKKMIENGKNGFLAENERDWEKYLRLLVNNKDLREKIGKQARLDSLEKHTTEKIHPETEKLVEYLKSKS